MLGRTVGHYRIESQLGEGGMGVVYKAEDVHLSRPVALKFLHSSTDAARLLAEAKAAGAINHPNICTIHEVDPEHAFIAMEYIDGRTLKARIDNRPLPADEALRIALAIGEGLRAAHDKGIIHRDIKSANVMVSDTGDVKVMDFGLARSSAQADATREGYSSGTPGYMAPEQERGEPLDRRADIWAFGAVLHEMLTGRLPTGGVGMLPATLDKIVRKALAPARDKRYQHIEDLIVDLRRVSSAQEGTPRSRTAVAFGAVAVIGIVAAGWLWLQRLPEDAPAATVQPVPLTSYPGSERQPSFSPDGTQIAFAWYREKSIGIYVKQIGVEEPTPLVDTPAPEIMPAWSPDGSRIAFVREVDHNRLAVVVIPQRGGPERALTEFVTPSLDLRLSFSWILAWTPDSRHLVATGRENAREPSVLYAFSLATGEMHRLTSPGTGSVGDGDPSVSPDGESLVFSRFGTGGQADLYLLPLTPDGRAGGEPLKLPGAGRINAGPSWTPDGKEIVFVSSAGTSANAALWRMDPTSRANPRRLAQLPPSIASARVAPRRNLLVYESGRSDSNIWQVSLGSADPQKRQPRQLIASTHGEFEPDFSPDGAKIAFMSRRSGFPEIWMCDRDGSRLVALTGFRGPAVHRPRFSPDGRRIVFYADAEGNRDIFAVTLGGELRQITHHASKDANPEWSRDGQWIYFISDRLADGQTTWKVRSAGGDAVPVPGITGGVQESFDGRWLYHVRALLRIFEIRRSPATGGQGERYLDEISQIGGWKVVEDGIYFVGPVRQNGNASIQFKSFQTGKVETLAHTLGPPDYGLAVSPDRKTILFAQGDDAGSDLMLVENFK